MSRTIDEKVVELRFNNQQFESGVKESLNTLAKLKEAVTKNISAKSLENVSKAAKTIDVSAATKGIEALENRFSTLGIVGMRVIENITDGLMGGLSRGIKSVTGSIISGGFKRAMNIENARFQLQGILSDASEVEAVMNQASESVDGTAYSFDAAAKAASMFTASGIKSGDQLKNALKGLAGSTATFNADYEQMSAIWTKISGQGRIMGDELNQLSNKGMNAAASLAKYFNEVNKDPSKASEEVQKAIKSLSRGLEVSEADIREFVSKGKISFDIFSEAMAVTFGDHAKDANKTFEGALANVKAALARTGEGIFAPLIKQEGPMVHLFNAIRVKINEFNAAFRASNGLVERFTKWISAVIEKLATWVDNFKIANTWIQKFGDGTSRVIEGYEKSIQKWGDGTEKVVNRQLFTPFHALTNIVNIFVNVLKGIKSVLAPIGKAFANVFSFKGDGIYSLLEALDKMSQKLVLSDEHARHLKFGFTGLFKVIASVLNVFGRLISQLTGLKAPTFDVSDGIFNLIKVFGEITSTFADFIDNSEGVSRAITYLAQGINLAKGKIGYALSYIAEQIHSFSLSDIAFAFDGFRQSIYDALPDSVQKKLDTLQEIFGQLAKDMSILDLSAISADFKSLGEVFADFGKIVDLLEDVKAKIVAFFDFSDEESGINKIMAKGNEFIAWYKNTIAPLFSNVTVAGALGGGGFLYIFITLGNILNGIAKILKGGGKTLTELPKLMKSTRKALDAYTADIKTDNIKKFAESLLMIAGAIFVLALIKPERLIPAATALALVGGVLLFAIYKLQSIPHEATTLATALNTAAKGLKSALKNIGRAILVKSLAKSVLMFVAAIGLIIAEIYALKEMVNKDPSGIEDAAREIMLIGSALLGIMVVFTAVGQFASKGMRSFGIASVGILALVAAVGVLVLAFDKLNSIELSGDWKTKIAILGSMLLGIAGLILVLGIANRIAGSASGIRLGKGGFEKVSKNSGVAGGFPLIACIGMIMASVWAIKELMAMPLSNDWKVKIGILAGIFVAMGLLILAMGKASKMAGGAGIKAGGTLLAMCITIAVCIGALKVLETIRGDKLRNGVLALGAILIGLALTLSAAGKISGAGAAATALSMCLLVVVMVGALSFLSIMSNGALLKGALSLCGILITLAVVFSAIGKMNNGNAYKPVLAMVLMVAVITASLAILSSTNWVKLLASAVSLGAVLLALMEAFKVISKSSVSPDKMVKKVGTFLLLGVSLYEIAGALMLASLMPWQNMLASGAAITAVLLAYSKAFETIGKAGKIDVKAVGKFLLGCLSLIVIAGALWIAAMRPWKQILAAGLAMSACLLAIAATFKIFSTMPVVSGMSIASILIGAIGMCLIGFALSLVAGYPWQNILAAAGAISACMVAIGVAMSILTAVGSMAVGVIPAIVLLTAGCIGMAAIGNILASLAVYDWQSLRAAGIAISMVLLSVAVAMAVCALVGTLAPAAIAGIAVFDIFIADLYAVLWALQKFGDMDVIKDGGQKLSAVGKVIGDFVGSIIEGIGEGVGKALEHIGTSLTNFMTNAEGFFNGLEKMNPDMVSSAQALAGVVLALTAAEFLSGITNLANVITLGAFGEGSGFGQKLTSFGKALSDFDEATKGITNAYHFKTVAEGASYLVELTKSLPNSGGFLGDIMGDNDADDWGKMIATMGKYMADLSQTIADADFSGFQPFAQAVKYLIDMTKGMPNSGGALGDVMGNNDADTWGEQCAKLGVHMKNLAFTITGVNFSGFQPFADAVQILIDMTNTIGNTGGVLGVFVGNNDADTWGTQLESLGKSVANFAEVTANVKPYQLSSIGTSIQKLVEVMNSLSGYGTVGVNGFVNDLNNLAKVGINEFIAAFKNTDEAVKAITEFMRLITDSIKTSTLFKEAGSESVSNYRKGIESKYSEATTAGRNLATRVINALKSMASQFKAVGATSSQNYAAGILAGGSAAAANAKTIATTAANNMNPKDENGVSVFYKQGMNAGQGYAQGIASQLKAVQDAAAKLAKAAEAALAKAQEAKSPAKKFIRQGEYAGEGYVIGITSWMQDAYNAGKGLANAVDNSLEDAGSLTPVITPIVDLTNVIDAAGTINSLFSSAIMSTGTRTNSVAGSFATATNNSSTEFQNEAVGSNGNTYNFIQNNNSPKSLSRVEIYRDSKNLFKQYREAVEGV